MQPWCLAFMIVLILAGFAASAAGQATFVIMTGRVTDSSGSALPDVKITLTNMGTGRKKAALTENADTRSFFKPNVRTFLKNWVGVVPTHHFALGVHNCVSTFKQLAAILNLETVVVAETPHA